MRSLGAAQTYWNLSGAERWNGGIYRFVEQVGDSLQLGASAFEGVALLPALDSGETDFRWGRVRLSLSLPPDRLVVVTGRTAAASRLSPA